MFLHHTASPYKMKAVKFTLSPAGGTVMMLNEQDAREKWCHITLSTKVAKCVASECMAWRWAEYTPHICEKCGTEDSEWVDHPEQRRGYCGLPGIPKL